MILKVINKIKINFIIFTICFTGTYFLFIHDSEVYLPKPYGYKFIDVPKNEYVKFKKPAYPYTFSISKHAVVVDIQDKELGPFCINIYYPIFDIKIQLTYKNFEKDPNMLRSYIKSSKSIAYKHKCRSYQIKDKIVFSRSNQPAVIIEIFGNVPTQIQFFATDEIKHFLRGALYFEYSTINEEVEPIVNFIKKDIEELIKTLEWK